MQVLKGSEKIGDHTVICDFIDKAPVIFDCGANYGEFAKSVAELFSAKIYGFEPDPRLFDKLPTIKQTSFFNLAITASAGSLKLALGENQCSSAFYREDENQEVVDVLATTIDDMLARLNLPKINLLKLDIEGAELELLGELGDNALSRIDQITVEFHDFRRKEDLHQIRKIIKRMRSKGFTFLKFSTWTYGDCVFLNRNTCKFDRFTPVFWLIYGKYLPGMARVLSRITRLARR